MIQNHDQKSNQNLIQSGPKFKILQVCNRRMVQVARLTITVSKPFTDRQIITDLY